MMNDISHTLLAKSDQLNAQDLVGSPITITITKVRVLPKGSEQPLVIDYEGGEGRPYKPSKGMRVFIARAWGVDSAKYIGRRMTLFHEPTVVYAGRQEGGIRISALSDISAPVHGALRLSKSKVIEYTIQPLGNQPEQTITEDQARADMAAAFTMDELAGVWKRKTMAPHRSALEGYLVECKAALSPGQSEPQNQGNAGDYPGV